ncbi:MarR family transcriptional regulator [Novosphingobium sp. ZN18A2]|uniref:MarR family winged helix-turn-helix transcriptional regulator n=1 Tax=Novosphingobium sp. ZN18A2 TaxID=3079861 RepID=UPI0030D34871
MRNNIAFLSTDVGRLLRKRFDAVARNFGVTGPQWRVLVHLDRTPGINQGTLADRLEVEAITVGRMIDRLEKAGMVERRPDPTDRRAWRLYLCEEAQPLLGQLRDCAEEVMRDALTGFDDAEHEKLLEMLERVRSNLCEQIVETQVAHG